ncbi:MAG: HD-GYP domain-containing protein [Betaproteobacteria bacterium]
MPLPGSVYDEHGHMLLAKGQMLESQYQLDELLARGLYVEVALFEAHFKHSAGAAPAPEDKFDPFLVRATMKLSLNRLLHGIAGATAEGAQIVEFAQHLQHYADADPEAAVAASLLDRQEESYAAAHSLSCATLCALLAKRFGWPEERRLSVVCAALTMNLGMLELQQRLLRHASPLTPPQLAEIHAHPDMALAALQALGIGDEIWLEAVHQHHEKPDGNGYPRHLTTLAEEGQLLRLVDVYFARASVRADRPALTPAQIVRALFMDEGKGSCAPLVASLVKLLGLYPPGSFVKLANGEVGVVFRHGETPTTPIAAAVTTASGMPTMQPVRRDTGREAFAIAGTIVPEKVSIGYDLGKLWVGNRHA